MSAPAIKSEASGDVVATIDAIEAAADQAFETLSILSRPANVAKWALLTHVILTYTEPQSTSGATTGHAFTGLMVNSSMAIPRAIAWIEQHGRAASRLIPFRFSDALAADAREAFDLAFRYQTFCVCLPMWHRDRYAVELLSQSHARFTVPGDFRNRQVSAYQKGFRPVRGDHAVPQRDLLPRSRQLDSLVDEVLDNATAKRRASFSYAQPTELLRHMHLSYRQQLDTQARRPPTLNLGTYTLGEFNEFFAALDTLAAAHDFLCFAWGKRTGIYPQDSAVIVKPRMEWARSIARLSGLSINVTNAILDDLTLCPPRSVDLILQPFVALDASGYSLALAPPFPLKGRPDENILRVLSMSKCKEYDLTTLSKEEDLRRKVEELCPQFLPRGPRSMPAPCPDIDIMLVDEGSSTLVICEAKWIRKTLRSVEHFERDKDVTKGFSQLGRIREYLVSNPRHLRQVGSLPRPIDRYRNVFYVLLARDHWLWREPADSISILEFEAFVRVLSRAENLKAGMDELLRYDWLPVEGRDFIVRLEQARAGGVVIESQIFYSLADTFTKQQRI